MAQSSQSQSLLWSLPHSELVLHDSFAHNHSHSHSHNHYVNANGNGTTNTQASAATGSIPLPLPVNVTASPSANNSNSNSSTSAPSAVGPIHNPNPSLFAPLPLRHQQQQHQQQPRSVEQFGISVGAASASGSTPKPAPTMSVSVTLSHPLTLPVSMPAISCSPLPPPQLPPQIQFHPSQWTDSNLYSMLNSAPLPAEWYSSTLSSLPSNTFSSNSAPQQLQQHTQALAVALGLLPQHVAAHANLNPNSVAQQEPSLLCNFPSSPEDCVVSGTLSSLSNTILQASVDGTSSNVLAPPPPPPPPPTQSLADFNANQPLSMTFANGLASTRSTTPSCTDTSSVGLSTWSGANSDWRSANSTSSSSSLSCLPPSTPSASAIPLANTIPISMPFSLSMSVPMSMSMPMPIPLAIQSSSSAPANSHSEKSSLLDSQCVPFGARRKVACQPCAVGKASCTGGRPCDRCVRLNRADKCVDRAKSVKCEKNSASTNMGSGNSPGDGRKVNAVGKASRRANNVRRLSPNPLLISVRRDLTPLWSYGGDGRRWSSYLLFCHGKFGTANLMMSALERTGRLHEQRQNEPSQLGAAPLSGGDDSVTVYLYLMNMKLTMHIDDFRVAFSMVDENLARHRAMRYLLEASQIRMFNSRSKGPAGQKRLRSRSPRTSPHTQQQTHTSTYSQSNPLVQSSPRVQCVGSNTKNRASSPFVYPPPQKRKKNVGVDAAELPRGARFRDCEASAGASASGSARPSDATQPSPGVMTNKLTTSPTLIFSWAASPLTATLESDSEERIIFPTIVTRMVAQLQQSGTSTADAAKLSSDSARTHSASPSLSPTVSPSPVSLASSPSDFLHAAHNTHVKPLSLADTHMRTNTDDQPQVPVSQLLMEDTQRSVGSIKEEKNDIDSTPSLQSHSFGSASSPSPSSCSVSVTAAPVIELRCSASVNVCYENFFGEQQSSVRDDFIRLGFRAFYKRLDESNMPNIQEKTIQAIFKAGERVFHCPVECRTASGIRRCLLYAKYCHTRGNQISCAVFTFIPMDYAQLNSPSQPHSPSPPNAAPSTENRTDIT